MYSIDLMQHHATPGQSDLEGEEEVSVTQTWALVLVPPDLQWQGRWDVVPVVAEGCHMQEADNQVIKIK